MGIGICVMIEKPHLGECQTPPQKIVSQRGRGLVFFMLDYHYYTRIEVPVNTLRRIRQV